MSTLSLTNHERTLKIEGVINFRDLGGYVTTDGRKVKWGQVYRSAQLDRLSDVGIKKMAEMDIQSVIDLRFSDETRRYPTIREAVPNAQISAWQDELEPIETTGSDDIQRSWKASLETNDPAQVREAMRVNYPKKLYSHRAIYRKMLLQLAKGQLPLVFHCAAGKDRTGVAAALLLSLLGVNDKQIVQDYLLTQQEIQRLLEDWMSGGAGHQSGSEDFQKKLASYPRDVIQPVFDADESYIQTLLDYVDQNYGGFTQYALRILELERNDIESLKNNLLV